MNFMKFPLLVGLCFFWVGCASSEYNQAKSNLDQQYYDWKVTDEQYAKRLKEIKDQEHRKDMENGGGFWGRYATALANQNQSSGGEFQGYKKYYTHGGYMSQDEHNSYVNSQPKLYDASYHEPASGVVMDQSGNSWHLQGNDIWGSNGDHYHQLNDQWVRDDGKWIKLQGNQIINSDGGNGLPK